MYLSQDVLGGVIGDALAAAVHKLLHAAGYGYLGNPIGHPDSFQDAEDAVVQDQQWGQAIEKHFNDVRERGRR